ncbi:MAG: gluconokinase [Phycisphaeraceae bacterium]
MIVIVMGVSGCGKTTVGQALAGRLGLTFLDADDHHPAANVAKMSRGEALTDADRGPWLDALNRLLRQAAAEGRSVALACSALRRAYRDRLTAGLPAAAVRWVYLRADEAVIAGRMQGRRDHFMPVSLLRSQFQTLEEPGDEAVVVDAGQPAEAVVAAVEQQLGAAEWGQGA